jgi:hypothetical protein
MVSLSNHGQPWLFIIRLSAESVAPKPNDGKVEGGQKFGSIARLKGLWAAGHLPCRAKIGHQVARRERHADGVFRQSAPVGRYNIRPRLYAPMRERNVSGDDDGAARGPFRYPIVSCIGMAADDNALDQRRSRNCHGAVADDIDFDRAPLGHAIDFRLYRAGVGVDKDCDRLGGLGQRFNPGVGRA